MFGADSLRQALSTLGVLLADRGFKFEIVAVGGGGLLLLGVIQRPTKDLDALAVIEAGEYHFARPLPKHLREVEFASFMDSVITHVEATRAKR